MLTGGGSRSSQLRNVSVKAMAGDDFNNFSRNDNDQDIPIFSTLYLPDTITVVTKKTQSELLLLHLSLGIRLHSLHGNASRCAQVHAHGMNKHVAI